MLINFLFAYKILKFDLVGCWLVYKLLDGKMHELVTYELMSANDAPERDPRDWYDALEPIAMDFIVGSKWAVFFRN